MPPFSQGEVQTAVIQARERERESKEDTLAEPNKKLKHTQCARIS